MSAELEVDLKPFLFFSRSFIVREQDRRISARRSYRAFDLDADEGHVIRLR